MVHLVSLGPYPLSALVFRAIRSPTTAAVGVESVSFVPKRSADVRVVTAANRRRSTGVR
jgi:hypothetical protein